MDTQPVAQASRARGAKHALIYVLLTIAIGLHFVPAELNLFKRSIIADPSARKNTADSERLPAPRAASPARVEEIEKSLASLSQSLRGDMDELRRTLQAEVARHAADAETRQQAVLGAAARNSDSARPDRETASAESEMGALRTTLGRLEHSAALMAADVESLRRAVDEAKASAADAARAQSRLAQESMSQARLVADLGKAIDIERNKTAVLLLLAGLNVERTDIGQINARLVDIAGRFPGDDPINTWIAEVKSLLGSPLLTTSALRDRFHALLPDAIRIARQASGNWVQRSKSSAVTALSNIGFVNPPDANVSEMALNKAADLLDRQDLRGALFELTAVDRDVSDRLSSWIIEARLRLTLADGINNIILRANALTE